jgi:hypothetical protein
MSDEPKQDVDEILDAAMDWHHAELVPKIRGALALLRQSPLTDTDDELTAAAALLAASLDDLAGVVLAMDDAATAYGRERSATVRRLVGEAPSGEPEAGA